MRKISLLLPALVSISLIIRSQSTVQNLAIALKKTIAENHISPRPVDDLFSADLFDGFMDALDPGRVHFTAEDFKTLSADRFSLDDEINGKGWTFLSKIVPLYRQRLLQSDSMVVDILRESFNLSLQESYRSSTDTSYCVSAKERTAKWKRILKYETIQGLSGLARAQFFSNETINRKLVMEKEKEIRETVKTRNRRQIKSLFQGTTNFEDHVGNIYLDMIATCFDPHTNYFPQTEKQNFEAALRKEGYYFGFTLEDNAKNEPSITHLVPGGPAWKTGELNKGDVLLQLKWEGKEPIDLVGAGAMEVSDLLDQSNFDLLELTVRKTNGQVKKVNLRKEKMNPGESDIVKSFVLSGEKNIGYISLPGFYTDWESEGGSSCANDVAKEIVKLRKEKIDALILDLRFNGGGSLMEALDLAGIFIQEGPLSIIKTKEGKLVTLKDPNRGTIYDGPLLVLVNGQSASASELVAAALQDYNRAIIAGSNTYGKATGQDIFPLQAGTSSMVQGPGFVKVTLNKLYRVSGKTAQKIGVMPDIEIPDLFEQLEFREAHNRHSLASDSVAKNPYYKPHPAISLGAIHARSKERVAADRRFQLLLKAQEKIGEESRGQNLVSLKWDDVEKEIMEEAKMMQQSEKMPHSGKTIFRVVNHHYDKERLVSDPYMAEINKNWIERLARDIQIEEAFRILVEYSTGLNTTKN